MSTLVVETAPRYLERLGEMMVVLRLAGADFERSVPYRVSSNGSSHVEEVPPGVLRVELRLPNGDRRRASVNVPPSGESRVLFKLDDTPHEWLAAQSFVAGKPLSTRRFDVARPTALLDLRTSVELAVMRATDNEQALPTANGIYSTETGNVLVIASKDAIRVSFDSLETPALSNRAWLAVRMRGGERRREMFVALPPLENVDAVIRERERPSDEELEQSESNQTLPVEADIVVNHPTVAPLLGYLSALDLDSADVMYDELAGSAHDALQGKLVRPGLAIVGAYALVALGRFRPDRQTSNARYELEWLRNLWHYFPQVPDGRILWATATIQAKPGEAESWFTDVTTALVEAAFLPIPTMSMGIRWLVDGLVHLQLLTSALARRSAGTEEIRSVLDVALEHARSLNAVVVPHGVFPTLSVSPDLVDVLWKKRSRGAVRRPRPRVR